MKNEIWQDVPGYEGIYQVSNRGRVKSLPREVIRKNGVKLTVKEKILRPYKNDHGYLRVNLRNCGRDKEFKIHRLVLEAFVGPCPDGMEACHFPDPDPTNNNLKNLRWDTPKNNRRDMVVLGNSTRGEKNKQAKLTKKDVIDIRNLYKQGKYLQKELAKIYHITQQTVSDIIRGKRWAWLPQEG